MTKPNEDFKTWLDSVVEDTFNFAKNPPIDWPHISWLAFLEGRDARPVVVPIKKEVRQLSLKRKSFEWVCPECSSDKLFEHCGGCGVKLDWSKDG